MPGQIILGKFAGQFLGHLDDRPHDHDRRRARRQDLDRPGAEPLSLSGLDAGARSEGRTGADRALAPRAAAQTSMCSIPSASRARPSACFNALGELDPDSWTIVDDVASITQALIVDDGDCALAALERQRAGAAARASFC